MKVQALILAAAAATSFVSANPLAFYRNIKEAAANFESSFLEEDVPSAQDPAVPLPPVDVVEGLYVQKVDHFGNATGANNISDFQQWFAFSDTFYKPGGPVFFFIQGESRAGTSYMQRGIPAQLAQRYGGLQVSLEHRFYGAPTRSVPTADLSSESLKLLTSQQAIADNVQFIKEFPKLFPRFNLTSDTKWIAIGGSYPGNLAYCNEFGYLQDAVPHGKRLESHSLYSKYVNVDYQIWACRAYLQNPTVYPQIDATNKYYGGLNIRTSNIMWVNGDVDPWHWLSNYQSAPGLNQESFLIEGGHHCSELRGRRATNDNKTVALFDKVFAVYDSWLGAPQA
ncbi:hypothetical protein HDU76_005753 [Blyttiomyces sp. JEL0837]|nr:hypothetical protein HDU76_005753 [Blyttiomyces sp. JEL0837]